MVRRTPAASRELPDAERRQDGKRAEEALPESEERLRAVISSAPIVLFALDRQGVFTLSEGKGLEALGLKPGEVVGRSVFDVYRDVPEIGENIRRALAGEEFTSIVEVAELAFECAYSPLRDQNGEVAGVIGVATDITERARAEDALRRREAILEAISFAAGSFLRTADWENSVQDVLGRLGRATGVSRVYVFENHVGPDGALLTSQRYEWVAPGIAPQIDNPAMQDFPARASGFARWEETLGRGEPVCGHVREFPKSEQEVLVAQDIKSIAVVPIYVGEEWWGFLGFDECAAERDWSAAEVDALKTAAGILGAAIQRRRATQALQESEETYRDLVENINEVIYAVDTSGLITYVSPVVEQLGGYSPSEIIGRPFIEFIHPDDLLPLMESFQRTVSGNPEPFEYRVLTKSGEVHWVRTFSRPVFAGDRMVGLRAVLMDITDRKQAEQALRESEERYRSLIETSPDAITLTDLNTNIIMVNQQALALHGCDSAEDMVGRNALDFIAPEDRRRAVENARKALEAGSVRNIEYTLLRKDGTSFPGELSASCIVDSEGKPKAFIGVVRDITERKLAEETIRHLAYHDALTNLPNGMLFRDRLNLALAQARRNNKILALLFLDLDRFKLINDTLGHAAGDQLLQNIGEELKDLVRGGDAVARMGGDEFTVLLPGISQVQDAVAIAQRILESVKQPRVAAGHEFHITTSIGVAIYPSDGTDAEALMRNADTAMYRAKEQGRDNYQLYSPAMNANILERMALVNDLRHALEREEFVVYYQPQVNINTGQVVGAEALARWQHPERGLMYPEEFIPLAEDTGLIVPLGEGVLRTACAQNKAWQEAGFPPMRMTVNISARQFRQETMVETVSQVLKETGLLPRYLQLEITEDTLMQDVEFTIAMLRDLRGMGVEISIDDFGTGYSSLNYLRRFPIDVVKIDRSFVRDVTVDPNDTAIVTAIIALAQSLKLRAVAEGVETQEQLAFLRERQCHEMQGYLFSKPVPAEEFERILRQDRRFRASWHPTPKKRAAAIT